MKIKLTDLEITDLQAVRRKPGIILRVSEDLITFGLVISDGNGYRLTEVGELILKKNTPVLHCGQNMKFPLGMRLIPKRKL